ncbi:DUF559 domain-containing protein [Siminovitchia sp. FSL W7-1587]|uniref:endonuclease domain-containing protein n=1 Tax=Siminovitchia sp. FSL W7-1587 TaxID=2954699 RepID=UPI0030CD05F8
MSNIYEGHCKKNIEMNWDNLTPKVQEEINKLLLFHKNAYLAGALKCDSPIEQLLLVRIMHWIDSSITQYQHYDPNLVMIYDAQREVAACGKKYRIDIYVEVVFKGEEYRFAIECDGHDFHEKTKEQAARDKRRERDLQSAGIHVIRFTGSEIWADAYEKSVEAMKIIEVVSGLRKAINENIIPYRE